MNDFLTKALEIMPECGHIECYEIWYYLNFYPSPESMFN